MGEQRPNDARILVCQRHCGNVGLRRRQNNFAARPAGAAERSDDTNRQRRARKSRYNPAPFERWSEQMRRVIWAAALVSLVIGGGAVAADTFGASGSAPAAHLFTVGKLKLASLHDAQFVVPNDSKTFGVGADPASVSDVLRTASAPTDRITLSVSSVLVRTGHRVILIDTGLGPKAHGALLASLHEAGVKPTAVTDVLITHSHGDHVGGLLDADGKLAFPKATIRMSSTEWTFMQSKGSPDLVKAISKHVHTFEPGAQIAPGVTSVALKGHTPGHVGYEISSEGQRLLDIGDTAHSFIVSLRKPQWGVQFDTDDAAAKATRASELKKLASDQELVFSPHFPFPGVGHIEAAGDGFVWKPVH
jgi:glyoxylase-like metal-dependent hydrolase (beta-lactamase superfamily II)